MKQYLLLFILSFLFNCCNSNKKEDAKTIMVDPNTIRPGEVVNDSLNASQLAKIKQIQATFAEVYPVSLEETMMDFKRDANPDKEIAIWLDMSEAYQKYLKSRRKIPSLEIKKEVFKLLLSRSMMPDEEAIKNSSLKILSIAEAKEVLNFYSNEPKPIDVIIK